MPGMLPKRAPLNESFGPSAGAASEHDVRTERVAVVASTVGADGQPHARGEDDRRRRRQLLLNSASTRRGCPGDASAKSCLFDPVGLL